VCAATVRFFMLAGTVASAGCTRSDLTATRHQVCDDALQYVDELALQVGRGNRDGTSGNKTLHLAVFIGWLRSASRPILNVDCCWSQIFAASQLARAVLV